MTSGIKTPKEEIIKNLKATGGNITATAKNLNVSRESVQRRVSAEPELRAITDEFRQAIVDEAEHGLKELIHSDNPAVRLGAVKYALSTIGKNRGYTEKQELDVSGMTVIIREKDTRL